MKHDIKLLKNKMDMDNDGTPILKVWLKNFSTLFYNFYKTLTFQVLPVQNDILKIKNLTLFYMKIECHWVHRILSLSMKLD